MNALLTGPLTTERIAVTIRDLPLSLHGITVVQLSDFHFDGKSLSEAMLITAIERCNAIAPDLVVLTGDFITEKASEIYPLAAHLQNLQARHGVYAVLGNHDSRPQKTRPTVTAALSAAGIQPLWNEVVYPLGTGLALVGLADLWSRECHPMPLLNALPPALPRLVLAHNPDTVDHLQTARADLVLSGHTHGGQVMIPGYGSAPLLLQDVARWLPARLRKYFPFLNRDCDRVCHHWERAAGLYTLDHGNQLYVNRGLGSYAPGRLFCPPELTVIELLSA